jgi:hypothetical protein
MCVVVSQSFPLAVHSYYMADSEPTRKTFVIKDLQKEISDKPQKEDWYTQWFLKTGPTARMEARKRHLSRPGVN